MDVVDNIAASINTFKNDRPVDPEQARIKLVRIEEN
jgi:hypothetical protein